MSHKRALIVDEFLLRWLPEPPEFKEKGEYIVFALYGQSFGHDLTCLCVSSGGCVATFGLIVQPRESHPAAEGASVVYSSLRPRIGNFLHFPFADEELKDVVQQLGSMPGLEQKNRRYECDFVYERNGYFDYYNAACAIVSAAALGSLSRTRQIPPKPMRTPFALEAAREPGSSGHEAADHKSECDEALKALRARARRDITRASALLEDVREAAQHILTAASADAASLGAAKLIAKEVLAMLED